MKKVLLGTLAAASLFLFGATAGAQDAPTKRLFYMVSPHFSAGPDLPKRATPWTEDELFELVQPAEGKTFAIAIFTLTGEKGEFTTTAMAHTKVNGEFRAWNIIVKGSPTVGSRTSTYVTETNGAKATMAFNDALYLVATEIQEVTVDEKASKPDLEKLFAGTLKYLQSLL